ncbi:MAG: hypothetical protein HZA58_04775 [Acidimicrobiia bacterium]|nr:hypothetical protein [Acidimicrobiia bacterium]
MTQRDISKADVELVYRDAQMTWPDADPLRRNYARWVDGRRLKVTVEDADEDHDPVVITAVDLTEDEGQHP